MYNIIDREQDVAGKHRIRVEIAGETVMFKFDKKPSNAQVQAEAAKYDARMQEQANAVADPE